MKGNKTTKEHFLIFKRECLKWINKYGLKAWDIAFEHKEDGNNRASCTYDVVQRWAILTLNTDWDEHSVDKVTTHRLRRDAYHEVSELLLCNLRNLAEYRYTTKSEIHEEVHAIIRTLENVVFEE